MRRCRAHRMGGLLKETKPWRRRFGRRRRAMVGHLLFWPRRNRRPRADGARREGFRRKRYARELPLRAVWSSAARATICFRAARTLVAALTHPYLPALRLPPSGQYRDRVRTGWLDVRLARGKSA